MHSCMEFRSQSQKSLSLPHNHLCVTAHTNYRGLHETQRSICSHTNFPLYPPIFQLMENNIIAPFLCQSVTFRSKIINPFLPHPLSHSAPINYLTSQISVVVTANISSLQLSSPVHTASPFWLLSSLLLQPHPESCPG